MKLSKVKGLEKKFRHDVCGVGNPNQPRCMFLRYVMRNGESYLVCAKNTVAGIKHLEIINELKQENPDGKLRAKTGELKIIGSDNCPGRAEEFAYLFENKMS